MELYEHIVMAYLTKDPYVFVSPQYSIRKDGHEWSCPDFVALNFKEKRVVVVEVSTAYDTKSLHEKVEKRESQWISPLREQLIDLKVIDEKWTFEVQVFIRKDAARHFVYDGKSGVKITILEELGPPWDWDRG